MKQDKGIEQVALELRKASGMRTLSEVVSEVMKNTLWVSERKICK